MAILKDLIVHGSSRFLNKIYANEIQTPLIEAEAGIIKKLKANDATIVGLLDVQGQLHTNSWTNSNIATIDGSFYITPTLASPSGSVSFTSATTATFTGTYSAVSSLYIGNKTSSTVQWSIGSKLLITGEVQVDGEWTPLGTLLAILNANNPTSSMPVIEITDNRYTNPSSIVADIYSRKGNASLNYRNLKISLYQRKYDNHDFPLGIYMTALSQNGKTFLDIYGGVNSTETASYKDSNNNNISNGGFADPNVRIGNLAGIKPITTAAGTFTPQGWGIYTINGYFQGTIVSDSGVIGGWRIGDNSLYNTKSSYNDSKEGLYLGTDYIAGGLGEKWWLKSDGRVKIGAMTLSAEGVLSVPAANISGELTAATIDASKISSGDISSERITTNVLTALQAKLTNLNTNNLSAITANLGTITTGVIKHDTVGGTNGIWLSADTDTSSNITVGESTARKDWRLLVNNKFGVTKTGDLYASSANISGTITATDGTIGGIDIINGDLDVSSINIGDLSGEIGGRNLIINTLNPDATASNRPKIFGQTVNTSGRGTASVAEHGIRFTTTSDAYCYIYMGLTSITSGSGATLQGLTPGKTYTFSCDFSCKLFSADTSTTVRHLRFTLYDDTSGSFAVDGEHQNMIDLDASKKGVEQSGNFSYTFTLPANITKFGFVIRSNVTTNTLFLTGDFIELRNIKLEEGNKATKWSPAYEDVTVTSYITKIDDTGIKITPYDKSGNNYLQINSDAISIYRNNIETLRIEDSAIRIGKIGEGQKNVYIDSNSIDIRNNENVLASFTGEDIKFYDGGIEELEIASFGGANGVRIGSEKEVHFVIKNNGIKAQNENGSPVFSIETTEGLVGNVEKIASSGLVSTKNQTRTIETENLTSNSTFYIEQIRLMLEIQILNRDLGGIITRQEGLKFDSFKVNNEENEITLLSFQENENSSNRSARWKFITYLSTQNYSFTFGTSKTVTLSLEGVLSHLYTQTRISTFQKDISIIYNGNDEITFTACFISDFLFNSNSPPNSSPLHLVFGPNNSYYTYTSIMSYNTNSKAPALTFGTRLGTVGPLSTVIGEALYAPKRGQMTIGKFNYGQDTQASTYSFIVGNGQSNVDRSNAFTIDQNGNVGIQGKIHNIIISGNTETKLPLFHFEGKTWNISSIGANGAWYGPTGNDTPSNRLINVPGYTPVAIAGYSVWGGTHGDWCVVPRVYIDQEGDDGYGNPTPAMLQMYIWNQGSQAATNIKFTVEILYIADNFID